MNIKRNALNARTILSILLALATVAFYALSTPPEYKKCRGQRPDSPEFNGYPLGFGDGNCQDLPLIDARIMDGSGKNGSFSKGQSEHITGLSAKPGDTIRVLLWFHNSGSDLKRSATTARSVRIGAVFDTNAMPVHVISALISADNTETLTSSDHGGDMKVRTESPSVLQYVPDSGLLCIQTGDLLERGLAISQACGDYPDGKERYAAKITEGLINRAAKIGDIKAGDKYSGYVRFNLNVLNAEVHN